MKSFSEKRITIYTSLGKTTWGFWAFKKLNTTPCPNPQDAVASVKLSFPLYSWVSTVKLHGTCIVEMVLKWEGLLPNNCWTPTVCQTPHGELRNQDNWAQPLPSILKTVKRQEADLKVTVINSYRYNQTYLSPKSPSLTLNFSF